MSLQAYCITENERAAIELHEQYPDMSGAMLAPQLNMHKNSVNKLIKRVKDRAAMKGYSPEHDMTHPTPDTHMVKGVSTLYNRDGAIAQQWVKTNVTAEAQIRGLESLVEALKEDIPKSNTCGITPLNPRVNSDLANLHILTDYHIGMMCWADETGENWDTDKSEDMLVKWFEYAIHHAPAAKVGILAQMGDLLHFDSVMGPLTPASGNLLDADSRFALLVRVAIRSMRRIINMMLEKYEVVHIINSDANHDPTSSVWIREMLADFYSDNPRVSVDVSPDTYNMFEHGLTSLFFHHGHKKKIASVDDVFVAKFRNVFGRTKHSYGHIGHVHHAASKESALMIIEQHRTMAAHDAYATSNGYMSGRSAYVITYSKSHGEVSRFTITPEMLGY